MYLYFLKQLCEPSPYLQFLPQQEKSVTCVGLVLGLGRCIKSLGLPAQERERGNCQEIASEGQSWWFTPMIPALGRQMVVDL